jgi:two-component system, OmpR family, sensor histidine kinase BaeS
MRLGIRRKLIGTLMLVGLFPLAISLVVILGGGAAMQLSRIRNNYEASSAACAKSISTQLLDVELDRLSFIARAPRFIQFIQDHNPAPLPTTAPQPSDFSQKVESKWPGLQPADAPLNAIMENEISQRLRDLTSNDSHPRKIFVTNILGETIAADEKTNHFSHANQDWWQKAYDGGTGKLFITTSTTTTDPHPIVSITFPVYDTANGQKRLIGIIRDSLAADWLFSSLITEATEAKAQAQLFDLDSNKTLFISDPLGDPTRAEQFLLQHLDQTHVPVLSLFFNNMVIGATPVTLDGKAIQRFDKTQLPHWIVVVSKPSEEAMTPVYHLAMTVAGIGIALILVLFILGVAISNREIIMPILRLREATAAVGRGELNVRVLTADAADATFRRDELGELARDFDEMTRQLQKNVNQLARSNEAKRRFMELAGHELRTPVTYLLGVCQLAQKQIQQIANSTNSDDEASIALATRNAAAIQAAMGKISTKTQRLSRIIDNLLKLVNNDQFTTRLDKSLVDIRALLLQVTSDQRPFINERKQQLILDLAQNLPSIEADRDKLEDALTNLLSNAIRFSPDEGVVRVAAREVSGDMIEILVEDSGPGIPAQDLANLFEPFYTGSDILHHHSGTIEFGSKGIGLGLAIVRRFIELHGGVVRANTITRDNKTAGTQFQILLPLNKDSDSEEISPPTTPPSA